MIAVAFTWQLAPLVLAFVTASVAAGVAWKENK